MSEIKQKKCSKCDSTFPITEFYKHNQTRDGLLNECKTCTKNRARFREAKLRNEDTEWVFLENKKRR
jgi:NAD-dependent SIR2 family protein deacetylase